jgi:hypothetical protein
MPQPIRFPQLFILTLLLFDASMAEELSDNLEALRSKDESRITRAIEYLTALPFDAKKQKEIANALNALDQSETRELAEPALGVWATSENVPMLVNLLADKHFDRGPLLDIVERLKDDRFVEPMIELLSDPFDDGKRAYAILSGWGATANDAMVKHINHPHDEVHDRLTKLWEKRKIGIEARTIQSALDLGAKDEQTKKYAVEWLATQKTIPDSVRKQATQSALKILQSAKGFEALGTTEIIAELGHKDFRQEYIKLLESKEFHQWQSGLHGVILSKDVTCAKKLIERMADEQFAGQVSKIMTRHGSNSEPLGLALLKQPIEKQRGYAHIVACGILGEIGTKKSLPPLVGIVKRQAIPESLNNAAKVAVENITRRFK